MRLASKVSIFAAFVFALGISSLGAARNSQSTEPASRLELVVLEVKNCTICSLVRTNIQPAYERSPHARAVPLRYVDITSIDEMGLGLKARVDTVPTVVLLRDGAEVDRITGYVAPETFFHALKYMMDRAED